MTASKVSVTVVNLDNSLDEDSANIVLIKDYDKCQFLLVHVIIFETGEITTMARKTFADATFLDCAYEEKKKFLVDQGNWNICFKSTFNPTLETLTDQSEFMERFLGVLGKPESLHLFKEKMQRGVSVEGTYQIKTMAHEGIW